MTPADLDELPPPPPMTLDQRRTYWGYRLAWDGVAAMPEPLARRLPGLIGPAWHRNARASQRARVRDHLARMLPRTTARELDEAVRTAYESYARYWIEAFRLHRMDPDEVTRRTSTENLAPLDEALARGGAVLATAHLGSWDLAALWATHRGWPLAVVAEVVEPRPLFDRFVSLRRGAGLGVVPLVPGGDMLDRMVEVVEDGGLATLLADRDLGGRGPVVEFFGEPCRMPPGPAAIARRTGCPVAVGAVIGAGPGRWHAVIEGDLLDLEQLSVSAGTQLVARRLEQLIARDPTQWHVFVRQWLVDREPDHPAVAAWRRDPEGGLDDPSWRAAEGD